MSAYTSLTKLLDRRRLHALYLTIRHDPPAFDSPDPDPRFLELVETPFETLPDAHDRLARLEHALRDRRDRRAVFLTIYENMTRAVQHRIESSSFQNAEWMRDYTVTFTNYYRRAFLAYERGETESVPAPWRIAFGAATEELVLVAQDVFLGINAHINYDLALTIRDVGISSNRSPKYRDHRAINAILARLIDAQQTALTELYAPGIDDVDTALGRFDESLSLFTMTEARELAWRTAVILTDTHSNLLHQYTNWLHRVTATGAALFVLTPSIHPGIMQTLQQVERDRLDFHDVIDHIYECTAAAIET